MGEILGEREPHLGEREGIREGAWKEDGGGDELGGNLLRRRDLKFV